MSDEPSSPVSIRAEISEDSSRKIVDALVDLFSPITEVTGLLGDRVKAYRAESAIRILARTRQLAEESGLTLKAPPLKFLLPFIEKCSLEEEDSDLHEMWSRLLLSASTDFSPEMLIYADIISKLTPEGARILKVICEGGRSRSGGLTQISENWTLVRPDQLRAWVANNFDFSDFDASAEKFLQSTEWPGVQVCTLVLVRMDDGDLSDEEVLYHPSYKEDMVLSYSVLENLGLITFYQYQDIYDEDDGALIVALAAMTTLGGSFYLACQRPDARTISREG